MDGFDRYGIGSTAAAPVAVQTSLLQEWNTVTAGMFNIVAPLSLTGYALNAGGGPGSMNKTLPGNYPRLIGGYRFSSSLAANTNGITFTDVATAQCSIILLNTGAISLRTGAVNGAAIATSGVTVTANSVHYLEFDLTFSNTGSYQIWLDGISILSGTADLTASANNYANVLSVVVSAGVASLTIDDLYLFDTTGTTNNAVLLTSPRIETQFPSSDGVVQFAGGGAILGTSAARSGGTAQPVANQLRLRTFTPSVNMTLISIAFTPGGTNSSVQMRPVLYTDNAGVADTLISTGSVSVGVTVGVIKALPLTTPQSLTAGTPYWIGLMTDIVVTNLYQALQNGLLDDRIATVTFSSGAPATAPATSTTQSTPIWGNGTITGNNWYATSQNPPQGNLSYVFDAVVGHEDLYNFPNLSAPSTLIYAVAMKGNVSKSDAGAKTMSLRVKSGAVDSGGSASSLAPATSYTWMTSYFNADPANGMPWTTAGVNAAQGGIRVES